MKMQRPGKTTSHQALKFPCPALNKDPHVVTSCGTPRPRKDKEDSRIIALAIPNEMEISAGAMALGNAWYNMILVLL